MNIPRTELQAPERNIHMVAMSSIVISMAIFFTATGHLIYIKIKGMDCARHPVAGAHFLISLVVLSVSAYQAIISALVFIHTRRAASRHSLSSITSNHTANMTFIISVWFTSHLTILPIYWGLWILELAVSILSWNYILLLAAAVFGIVYQSVFTYFVAVMYRYLKMNSLIIIE